MEKAKYIDVEINGKKVRMKHRMAATRYAAVMSGCGAMALHKQMGNEGEAGHAARVGSAKHSRVEEWAYGRGDIPDEWKTILPKQEDILMSEQGVEIGCDFIPLGLACVPDLVTKEKNGESIVFDVKNAIEEAYNDYQVGFNIYVLKKAKIIKKAIGKISYLLEPLRVVGAKHTATKATIIEAWERMKEGKANREGHKLCRYCDLKKTCPEWISNTKDKIVKGLVDNQKKLDNIEARMNKYADIVEIISELRKEAKPINEEIDKLKILAREKLAIKSHILPDGTGVKMGNWTSSILPEDFSIKKYGPDKEKYKKYWKDPELKKRDFLKDFGETKKSKTVSILMEAN